MRIHPKPVRKCHACLLNLGDRCWLYEDPRGQWRGGGSCPGFENEAQYEDFRRWQKRPRVKTSKDLRREFIRGRRKKRLPGDRPRGE